MKQNLSQIMAEMKRREGDEFASIDGFIKESEKKGLEEAMKLHNFSFIISRNGVNMSAARHSNRPGEIAVGVGRFGNSQEFREYKIKDAILFRPSLWKTAGTR